MPPLLKQIEALGTTALRDAIVFRHMLADIPPGRANTRGARWNPPDVAAIYTSFERDTALAEADYYLSLQNPTPRVRRTIYRIRVRLDRVVELRDSEILNSLGVSDVALPDLTACQRVGGAELRTSAAMDSSFPLRGETRRSTSSSTQTNRESTLHGSRFSISRLCA